MARRQSSLSHPRLAYFGKIDSPLKITSMPKPMPRRKTGATATLSESSIEDRPGDSLGSSDGLVADIKAQETGADDPAASKMAELKFRMIAKMVATANYMNDAEDSDESDGDDAQTDAVSRWSKDERHLQIENDAKKLEEELANSARSKLSLIDYDEDEHMPYGMYDEEVFMTTDSLGEARRPVTRARRSSESRRLRRHSHIDVEQEIGHSSFPSLTAYLLSTGGKAVMDVEEFELKDDDGSSYTSIDGETLFSDLTTPSGLTSRTGWTDRSGYRSEGRAMSVAEDSAFRSSLRLTTLAESAGNSADGMERSHEKPGYRVSFHAVHIRHYERILCDNPGVSSGPSIGIGWDYAEQGVFDVDEWEKARAGNTRVGIALALSRKRREAMLLSLGYTDREIVVAVRGTTKVKNQRKQTIVNFGMQRMEEAMEKAKRSVRKLLFIKPKKPMLAPSQRWLDATGIDAR